MLKHCLMSTQQVQAYRSRSAADHMTKLNRYTILRLSDDVYTTV